MTKQEHLLMITMFAKQLQTTKILLQIMRSREIITADDERAFQSLVNEDSAGNAALMRDAANAYAGFAIKLGIDIDQAPSPS
jgi:hypothetical protein